MKIVVMKFGGTSVEDAAAIQRTAEIVAGRRAKGLAPVVIASAMSKVTDQLLAAAAAAERGDGAGALAISARLRHRHLETASALISGAALQETSTWLEQQFQGLDDLLRGLAAVQELTPRTSDLVVSHGERLSSRIIAEHFAQHDLNGAHVDARCCIVTDAQHGRALPLELETEQNLTPG